MNKLILRCKREIKEGDKVIITSFEDYNLDDAMTRDLREEMERKGYVLVNRIYANGDYISFKNDPCISVFVTDLNRGIRYNLYIPGGKYKLLYSNW